MYVTIHFNPSIKDTLVKTAILDSDLKMQVVAEFTLLELHLRSIVPTTVDRIVLHDHKGQASWETLKQFSTLCKKCDFAYSIVQKKMSVPRSKSE